MKPYGFSWIEEPLLAGLARPSAVEELEWLRNHGVDLLISLTEEKLPKSWMESAGLLGVHEPVQDMQPPTMEQVERIVNSILKAHQANMGVAVHCAAGMGRTGVALASYLVAKGMESSQAIAKIRTLRPGSVETEDQEQSVHEYARRLRS